MKTYADLDLIKIRNECGLDFARHTYSKGQCSCCYGPLDMPAKYWAKGKKPKKINVTRNEKGRVTSYQWDRDTDEIPYILFKNANNGSGRIKSLDEPVRNYTCVEYHFVSEEQKHKVCQMLQEQLGAEYLVVEPENEYVCIEILLGEIFTVEQVQEMIRDRDYRLRKGEWYYMTDGSECARTKVSFDSALRTAKYQDIIWFKSRR